MAPIISFGITFITGFQAVGLWLEAPMKFFTFLGSVDFFVAFLPLVYWSIDAALGIRIGLILLVGASLNEWFKMALHGPRPYWVSTKVRALGSETGFGIPSGHSEISAGFWGMVGAYYRKACVWVVMVLLVFFIGLSRMYLGMHFPQDVLVGWALGFLTLWAFVRLWDPVEARVKKMSFWRQISLAFVTSLAMILLGGLIAFLSRDFVVPAEWIANATRGGGAAPAPFSMDGLITVAATFFGVCVGLAWLAPRGGFKAVGPFWQRAVRYAFGLIGVLILYVGLKAVFPAGQAFIPYTFRFLRYTLVGFWIIGGAPWAFWKLKLAQAST